LWLGQMYTSRIILSRAIEYSKKFYWGDWGEARAAAGAVWFPDGAGFFCAVALPAEGCLDLAPGRGWEVRGAV